MILYFGPWVSIYFHKLYGNQDNLTYFDNVQWNGRKPRIKSDYVNVVLDIGYTMLFNIVDAMLQVYGFDTYYGVFHKCFLYEEVISVRHNGADKTNYRL